MRFVFDFEICKLSGQSLVYSLKSGRKFVMPHFPLPLHPAVWSFSPPPAQLLAYKLRHPFLKTWRFVTTMQLSCLCWLKFKTVIFKLLLSIWTPITCKLGRRMRQFYDYRILNLNLVSELQLFYWKYSRIDMSHKAVKHLQQTWYIYLFKSEWPSKREQ